MKKSNKGITLIALVITIIILIILAGVSINLIIGKNGIIQRTILAKEQTTIKAIQERLELVKGSSYIKEEGNSNIDKYFTCLDKEKINPYIVTNTEKITDLIGVVEVDAKYDYIIKIGKEGNLTIEYDGVAGEKDRTEGIVTIDLSWKDLETTLPVHVVATIKNSKHEIKSIKWILTNTPNEIGTEESNYTGENSTNQFNIELGAIKTNYYLHVLTTDDYGRVVETIKGPIIAKEVYKTETYQYNYTCGWRGSGNYVQNTCPQCGGGAWCDSNEGSPKYKYYCKGDNDGTKTGTREVLTGYTASCN